MVTEHQNEIYVFIRSMIFNPDDARDILQDVNIVLMRKREKFVLGTNFKAWAFTIARFECLSYLSRYKKVQWTTLDTGLLESLASIAEEEAEDIKPWIRALRTCLQSLPEEFRQLIHHRYKQRIPLETTAKNLQTSVPALKQKLYRIRNNLRKCILQRLEDENNAHNAK